MTERSGLQLQLWFLGRGQRARFFRMMIKQPDLRLIWKSYMAFPALCWKRC